MIYRIIRLFLFALCLMFFALNISAADDKHELATNYIKQGDFERSLEILKQLIASDPDSKKYRNDYIHALGLAGEDQMVVDIATTIPLNECPPYVLETIALSARNLGNVELSEQAYRLSASKDKHRVTPKVGLALLLLDQNHTDQAIKNLSRLSRENPENTEVLHALAHAHELAEENFKAFKYYQRLYELKPDNQSYQRLYILSANKIGASHVATTLAEKNKEILSDTDQASLSWDRAARMVRWGEIPAKQEAQKFDETDVAIAALQSNISGSAGLVESDAWKLRAQFDLVVALRNRFKMKEVIEFAEAFQQRNIDTPAYVQAAIGDAYLYLERPSEAELAYKSALQKDPNMFNVKLSRAYALLDKGQYDEAQKIIENEFANQPPRRRSYYPEQDKLIIKGNPRKTTTAVMSATSRVYGNDLSDAQNKIEDLHERAPFNPNIQNELANIYYSRGWPRKSQAVLESSLSQSPRHAGLRVAQLRNQLELNQFRDAEKSMEQLINLHPENRSFQKQHNFWKIHNDPELEVKVFGGPSSGSTEGDETITFEGRLFSAPVDYNYRFFIHLLNNRTVFPEGVGKLQHTGAGLEYKRDAVELVAEIHENDYSSRRTGISLSTAYELDDLSRLFVEYESFSKSTPYRALKNNVFAESFEFTAQHRVHESEKISATASVLSFSDNNIRSSIQGDYTNRWVKRSHYLLDGSIDVYYSNNSKKQTPYFNPESDFSLSLTAINDWLSYQHYDESFRQKLAVSIGGYWQQSFGTDLIGSIQYSNEWATSHRLFLDYGLKLSTNVYDGDREQNLFAFLNMNWRF